MIDLLNDHLGFLPDPIQAESLGWLALGLFALTGGINQILRLTDRLRPKEPEPPLIKQFADRVETEKRFDRINKRIEAISLETDRRFDLIEIKIEAARVESRNKFDEHHHASEERAQKIHDRINQVLEAVSTVRGRIEAWNEPHRS
jgi:hypothetical protein